MKNIFHRYLNLPFEITKHPICDTIPTEMKHLDINPYRDTKMDDFHKSLGLVINHVELFYTPPGASLPVHADDVTIDNHVKINITYGPPEGRIRWWTAKDTKVVTDIETAKKMLYKEIDEKTADQFSEREHTNVLASRDECNLVWEANTNRPSLVNVGQLHDTYSPPHAGRWTLCFVPGVPNGPGYIYWDEAMEIYKDYIEEDI